MKKVLLVLSLALGLIFWNGCRDAHNVIDYAEYQDDYHSEDFDSTYVLSEMGFGGKKTVFLNIHCTATKEGYNLKGDWFLDFFKNDRKWDKPGYNEIVELDGNRFIAVPYDLDGYTTFDELSYGVKGYNSISINIAYVGGVDKNLKPKDTRTKAQIRAIDQIVKEVRAAMPSIAVMGHRDHKNVHKACPSFDVHKEYGDFSLLLEQTTEVDYIFKDSLK